MTQATNSTSQQIQPIGSRENFVMNILGTRGGLFALVALIVEGGLFLLVMLGRTDIERLLALGGFLVVLVVILVLYSFERRHIHFEEMKKLELRAVPASMMAEPIAPAEAQQKANLAGAPDGTFFYAPPPANWRVEVTTTAEETRRLMDRQGMNGLTSGLDVQPFRSGDLLLFDTLTQHHIEYAAGRSTFNGRPAFAVFDEDISDQVRMCSVSKRGGLVRDMSAEHVFGQVLAMMMQGGLKIEEVRSAPVGISGRATLTACGAITLGDVKIDGNEVSTARVEARLHIVEHETILYVIQTRLVTGLASSEARRTEIDAIIASFQPTTAADTAARERRDAEEAEASFQEVMANLGSMLLGMKAEAVIDAICAPDDPQVTAGHVGQLEQLAAYAQAHPSWVQAPLRVFLEQLLLNARQALDGNEAPLAAFLQASGQQAAGSADNPALPAA